MSRASLDKDPRAVASMFDGVARRYDITNTVLSAGRDRYWRRATRAALRAGPGDTVLDLAAGTAVSTVEIAKSGAWCLAADFSVGMLHAGHQRPVPKVGADATRLPFGDDVFEGRIAVNNGAAGTASNVAARGMCLAGAVGSSFLGTPGIDLHQNHRVDCTPDPVVYAAAVERNLGATADMFLARLSGAW